MRYFIRPSKPQSLILYRTILIVPPSSIYIETSENMNHDTFHPPKGSWLFWVLRAEAYVVFYHAKLCVQCCSRDKYRSR